MSFTQQEKFSSHSKCEEKHQTTNKLKLAMTSFHEFENIDSETASRCKNTDKINSSNENTTSLYSTSDHDNSTVWSKSKGSYESEELKQEEDKYDFHINLINLKPQSTKEVSKSDNGFSDDDLQLMMSKRISGMFIFIIQFLCIRSLNRNY